MRACEALSEARSEPLEGLEAPEPGIHAGLPAARLNALQVHRRWAECARAVVQRPGTASTRSNRAGVA